MILPPGKLPLDLLQRMLEGGQTHDPRVLIGPRVGTDAAAISMGDQVLIAKSDPITFATQDAGWYLVNVNANDVACMGAMPRWLLVTALLPEKSTTANLISELFSSIQSAATELGVTVVGGHSEITLGIDRPILMGTMLGEVEPARLVDPGNVAEGDVILLCKGIAIEGTALLAREARKRLETSLDGPELDRAAAYITSPGISVVAAAQAIANAGVHAHAMHDPTEGGLATALREVSIAAQLNATIELDRILIYEETRAICDVLEIDPLGLIASGALLAIVAPDDAEAAIQAVTSAGIPCTRIGCFGEPGADVTFTRDGSKVDVPDFEVDEIARYFASNQDS